MDGRWIGWNYGEKKWKIQNLRHSTYKKKKKKKLQKPLNWDIPVLSSIFTIDREPLLGSIQILETRQKIIPGKET